MVSEICKKLNGSFCIISGENYLLVDNQGTETGETSFHGTTIRICISSKDISNAQKIISEICSQGENEAKTMRTAFQTASTPSKGLIEHLKYKK